MANLPHSVEAEKAILGWMLHSKKALNKCIDELNPGHFYIRANRIIFTTFGLIYGSGGTVDLVTVVNRLESDDAMLAVGGIKYITELTDNLQSTKDLSRYISIVKNAKIRRELVAFSEDVKKKALESGKSIEQTLLDIMDELYNIGIDIKTNPLVHISDAMAEGYMDLSVAEDSELHKNQMILTPRYSKLQYLIPHFKPEQLITLAAPTGMGKTTLALNFAVDAAKKGGVVCLFSLEMSAKEIGQKVLASEGYVDVAHIEKGNDAEWKRLLIAQEGMAETQLWIDQSLNKVGVSNVRSKLQRLKAQCGRLDLVVIDYLQLMNMQSKVAKTRNELVGETTRALKELAREFKAPVMILSQLSREGSKGIDDGKEPETYYLKDSGSIEQDSDIVMMLWKNNSEENCIKLGVKKNRGGQTGFVELAFNGAFSRFESYYGEA